MAGVVESHFLKGSSKNSIISINLTNWYSVFQTNFFHFFWTRIERIKQIGADMNNCFRVYLIGFFPLNPTTVLALADL